MKDIKDYLHLYLGCEWQWKQFAGEFTSGTYGTDFFNSSLLTEVALKNGEAKPILRPLSDMTDEEREQLNDIELGESSWPTVARALAPCFAWMLSKGFDLFGLIESGLAIDKTKITQPA